MSAAPLHNPLAGVSTLFSADSSVGNLSRLVGLRWIAIVGQFSAVAVASGLVGIELPLASLLTVIGLLAAFNFASQAHARRHAHVGERFMFLQLCVDLMALFWLLHWSGGSDNPFVGLILLQLSIGAVVLPARLVAMLLVLAVMAFATLHVYKWPLHWPPGVARSELVITASAVNFLLSAGLIALFVTRMSVSLRERDRQLAQAREAKLRDQQIVAMGTLATGALHELGTPLSTIRVLVGELLDTHDTDPQLREDLALIACQVDACKGTLSRLAAQSGAARGERARAQTLSKWVAGGVLRLRALQPDRELGVQLDAALDDIEVVADETLSQALLNLLNNAMQSARDRVELCATVQDDALVVEIRDDGPGMSETLAAHAGERVVTSTRKDGMGMGLFLAHAVVARFDGRIELSNRPEGGLLTRLTVPLASWRV